MTFAPIKGQCPVCGYYCTGKGGLGCVDKPAMSQEDKPCSQHPDAPHGFDRNASHNAGRYVCECEGWEPVATQEPVAKVLGALMTSGRSEKYAMESYKPLEVGTLLYANAEPCARCAELEREKFDWKKEFGEDRAENIELQAKITEQAALIEKMDIENTSCRVRIGTLNAQLTTQSDRIKALEAEAADRESFLKTLADTCTEAERIAIERAGRIDVLEAECRKLRDALSEAEAFCKRKDITIERQRKGIELAKTALEKSVERDIKQWHNADIEGDDDDKPPEKLGDEVIQEQLKALAAIAELEKGVG